MDFKSLKDVNTSKALLKEIYDSFLAEIKKAKDIDVNAVKKGFNDYFVTFFKENYINFNGRIARHQFWMVVLYSALIGTVLDIIPVLGYAYAIALAIPAVCMFIRRLHDFDVSGWWVIALAVIATLIPILGFLFVLLVFALPGDKKANTYGNVQK